LIACESLVLNLRHQHVQAKLNGHKQIALHHIHLIEEDLLYLENRITEELLIVNEQVDTPHHPQKSKSDLLHQADQLVLRAEKALHHYRDSSRRELKAL